MNYLNSLAMLFGVFILGVLFGAIVQELILEHKDESTLTIRDQCDKFGAFYPDVNTIYYCSRKEH